MIRLFENKTQRLFATTRKTPTRNSLGETARLIFTPKWWVRDVARLFWQSLILFSFFFFVWSQTRSAIMNDVPHLPKPPAIKNKLLKRRDWTPFGNQTQTRESFMMGYHDISKLRLVINRTEIKRTVCESLLASNQTKRTVGVSCKLATMGDKKTKPPPVVHSRAAGTNNWAAMTFEWQHGRLQSPIRPSGLPALVTVNPLPLPCVTFPTIRLQQTLNGQNAQHQVIHTCTNTGKQPNLSNFKFWGL